MGTFTNFCSRASLLAALVVAGAHTVAAAQPVAQAPVARQMLGVGKGDARALKDIPEAQALVASLREAMAEQPTLRVIVGVRTAFAPEAALGAQGASSQRSDIARAQTLAIESLPGAFTAKVHRFETIPYFAMDVTSDQLEALLQLPDVTDVQEDQLMSKALGQSGPLISAPSVWSRGYTGAGWAVAVLDEGVQNNHPFLSGRIVHEACFSTQNRAAGTDSSYSLCPNQAASATGANAASQCYAVGSTSCSHGTHVAGIAAGNGSTGGVAYSGVARGGNIIPVQVFSYFDSYNDVFTWQSDQLKGLEHVYALRNTYAIAAVNMSLGGGRYTSQATCDSENSGAGSLKAAIDNLRSVGIATVIASGNSGYASATGAPGCISSAITVGATTDVTGQIDTSYSNSASFVDLVAPGSSIDSSVPFGAYANYNGTSMATPQVAGCWAVLKQVRPSASVQQIENALKTTGVSVTDPRNGLTFSRINCDAAAAQLLANPSLTTLTVQKTGSGNVRALGGIIDCGLNCSTTLASSTTVTLVASPAVGYEFLGWSGATGCGFARSCSLSMSASRTVTAAFGAPSVQYLTLTGLSQGGLAATTGNVLRSSATVPEGARNLRIAISGGSGDADLFVMFGSEPNLPAEKWECSSVLGGNTDVCTEPNPAAGTYHIALYAYSSFSSVTLTVTYELPDLLCTAGSTSLTGAVSDTRSSTYCGTITLSPSNLGYTANPTARVVVRAGSGVRLSPGFRLFSGALFKAASDTSLQSN